MSARDPRIRLVKADEKKSPPGEKDVAGGAECSTIQREELRRAFQNLRSALINATKQLETIDRLLAVTTESGLNTTQG